MRCREPSNDFFAIIKYYGKGLAIRALWKFGHVDNRFSTLNSGNSSGFQAVNIKGYVSLLLFQGFVI
jgi:hypothetical protein